MNLTKCIQHKNEFGKQGWLIQFPYDALFLNDDFKEAIDHPYREWNPATKTWWVDEECGGMLAGLFENWDMPITKNTMRWKPKCSICNDTGLVPSKVLGVFSKKPIPNCWENCECRDETEHYQRLRPSDFDFPMSETFRAFTYQYCNQPDPGLISEPPETTPQVIEHRHSDMSHKDYDLLQQTANELKHIREQLAERKKPIPVQGYRGIKG